MEKWTKLKIFLYSLAGILIFFLAICLVYFEIYYHAEEISNEYLQESQVINVEEIEDGYFFDGPGTNEALIFYPGAKVETKAYARLMSKFAEEGIDCFLVDMPFRFAFLGINKADKIIENYQYETWDIGGHSLGGVAASIYLKENGENFNNMILIGSYPTNEVPENVNLFSIYGSNDGVLNQNSYQKAEKFWNKNSKELVIEGANHASIADYGTQKGDGELTIDKDEVVEKIVEFFKS